MTKNELMKLLGIEALMKRNTRTKLFETMLDIICDFLMLQRDAQGGVDVPKATTSITELSTTSASSGGTVAASKTQQEKKVVALKKTTAIAAPIMPVQSKTQANFFNKEAS
jgi:hypothetical protein